MDEDARRQFVRRLTTIDSGGEYYAHTLTATPDGRVQWQTQSAWVGQGSKAMWELRAASLVHPVRMRSAWSTLGQPSVVVNDTFALLIHYRLGGNAVIRSDIVESWLPRILDPIECVPGSVLNPPRSLDSTPQASLAHRPSKKLRMDILGRDKFRCSSCRRRDGSTLDFELHVHHIRPFGQGGLTEPDNLITLCQTCHQGLDPHFEMGLFSLLPGGHPTGLVPNDLDGSEFADAVRRYRESDFGRATREVAESNARASSAP